MNELQIKGKLLELAPHIARMNFHARYPDPMPCDFWELNRQLGIICESLDVTPRLTRVTAKGGTDKAIFMRRIFGSAASVIEDMDGKQYGWDLTIPEWNIAIAANIRSELNSLSNSQDSKP